MRRTKFLGPVPVCARRVDNAITCEQHFQRLKTSPFLPPSPPIQSVSLSSAQPTDHKLRREIQRGVGKIRPNSGQVVRGRWNQKQQQQPADGARERAGAFYSSKRIIIRARRRTTLAVALSAAAGPLVERCQSLWTIFFAHLVYSANPFVPDPSALSDAEAIKPRRPLFVAFKEWRLLLLSLSARILARSCMSRHLPRGFQNWTKTKTRKTRVRGSNFCCGFILSLRQTTSH